MGIPSELRDAWRSRKKPLQVDSPHEPKLTENESTVKEAVIAGTKSAIIAGVVASVPVVAVSFHGLKLILITRHKQCSFQQLVFRVFSSLPTRKSWRKHTQIRFRSWTSNIFHKLLDSLYFSVHGRTVLCNSTTVHLTSNHVLELGCK